MATDPSTLDEGFSPLPAQTEPPDADGELALQEDLASGQGIFTLTDPQAPSPLGRSYAYDFIEHRLIPGQAGGPLMTRGLDTLATWIEKCLRTRRGENPAVDPDFGLEIMPEDLIDGGPFDAGAMAELDGAIRRGLLVHPRIIDVDEFTTNYDGDTSVYRTFRVIPEGDDLAPLTFDLPLPAGAAT